MCFPMEYRGGPGHTSWWSRSHKHPCHMILAMVVHGPIVVHGPSVLAGNNVPMSQECSERAGRSERSAHAEQCSERKSRFWVFQQLAKRLCPSELYRDSVQGGAVGWKSYLTAAETHDAAMIRTLASSVAAMYLAAGAFQQK